MTRVMMLLIAVILVLATAAPVAAQGEEQLPFKGAVHGYGMVEPDTDCPPVDLRSVFTTTGYVGDMGTIQLDYHNCTPEGPDVVGIEMTFVAESGDSVSATYEAHDVAPVGEDPRCWRSRMTSRSLAAPVSSREPRAEGSWKGTSHGPASSRTTGPPSSSSTGPSRTESVRGRSGY